MNVVYRGFSNPIKVAIPNTISLEASAPGLKKVDDFGNYTMYPQHGKTVSIKISGTLANGDSITRIKTLRIQDVKKLTGTLNGKSGILELKANQIINGKIEVHIEDFLFPWEFKVKRFKIKLAENAFVQIEGDTIPTELNDQINNLRANDIVQIFDIMIRLKNGPSSIRFKRTSPIKIIIKE